MPERVAEPGEPAQVGVHEVVVEHDAALELERDGQAHQRGEVILRAHRERQQDVAGARLHARHLHARGSERGVELHRRVAALRQLGEARGDRPGERGAQARAVFFLGLAHGLHQQPPRRRVDLEEVLARLRHRHGLFQLPHLLAGLGAPDLAQRAFGVGEVAAGLVGREPGPLYTPFAQREV